MNKFFKILVLFIFTCNITHAWLYVTSTKNFSSNSWSTNCWSWESGSTSQTSIVTGNVWSSWTFYCLKDDVTAPTGSVSYSPDTWTNTDVTVSITCNDSESGCDMYAISGWSISWNTYSKTFSSNTSGSISLKDKVGNIWTANYNITHIDKVSPVTSDVSSNLSESTYNLATNSKNINISVQNAGWSPINLIEAEFENTANNWTVSYSSTSSSLNKNVDISNVDNDINSNNYRDYTYNITKVCDQAGNCTNNIADFTYHVYANNTDTSSSSIQWTWNFDDEVADWSTKNLTIRLRDVYENKVVPVYENNWTTKLRDVTLKWVYNNSLYLDQVNNSWIWVEVSWFDNNTFENSIIWDAKEKSTTINDKANNDGNYTIKFKVYSPTANASATDGREYAKWNFTLTSVKSDLSDISWEISLNQNIDFQFKPVYYIENAWEIADDWFIEWRTQTWAINIEQNSSVTTTNKELYILQTWDKAAEFTSTWQIDSEAEKIIASSHVGIWTLFKSSFTNTTDYIFKILISLVNSSGYIDDLKDVQLKQYIKYNIASKQITYLAWILNSTNTQNFETLKVIWNTNIDKDKQKDLTANQDEEDIKNLAWEITKATLKRDIRKKSINLIKVIDTNNWTKTISNLSWADWSANTDWRKIKEVLYFWGLNWSNVVLNSPWFKLDWKKTIIVRWWNLYIKSNVINNTAGDILWIIVLKDTNNKWWNVYIDTQVQKLDAVIYADKSVISYNEFYNNWDASNTSRHEVDANINNAVMQNQLYIYGSVFSENTIWWAKLDPPVCPFYVDALGLNCDMSRAQRYDFNYLRWWTQNKYDPTYENYPVIIKYNSRVQTTPPPLFGN